MRWALLWVLALSALAFALMGADKGRARAGRRRIPERVLFAAAILGGSPGAIAGMWAFRHKTRHWYFRDGLPALLAAQLALAAWAAGLPA